MAQSGEAGSARAMEIWLLPFAAMFTQPSWLNAVALTTGALLSGFTHQTALIAEPARQPRTSVWKWALMSAPMKL